MVISPNIYVLSYFFFCHFLSVFSLSLIYYNMMLFVVCYIMLSIWRDSYKQSGFDQYNISNYGRQHVE